MGESMPRAFDAVIEAGSGGGAFVLVPFDVKEAFGSGRPKVRALIDGHEYRGSIANMGRGHCLGIRKDVRAAIGKRLTRGQQLTITNRGGWLEETRGRRGREEDPATERTEGRVADHSGLLALGRRRVELML